MMKYSKYVHYASIVVLALLALQQVSAYGSDELSDFSNSDSMMMPGNSTMDALQPQGNDNAIMDRFVSMCWWCNPMNQYLCCAGKSRWELCCGPETTTAKSGNSKAASKSAPASSAPASSAPASSAPASRR